MYREPSLRKVPHIPPLPPFPPAGSREGMELVLRTASGVPSRLYGPQSPVWLVCVVARV